MYGIDFPLPVGMFEADLGRGNLVGSSSIWSLVSYQVDYVEIWCLLMVEQLVDSCFPDYLHFPLLFGMFEVELGRNNLVGDSSFWSLVSLQVDCAEI